MQQLSNILFVGAGGFLGAVARYTMGAWVHRLFPLTTFPLGTLVVNTLGCFLIGLLGGLGETRQLFSPRFRVLIFIGILGGFTTFSSFAHETVALTRDSEMVRALLNVGLQLGCGLFAAWLGYALAKG